MCDIRSRGWLPAGAGGAGNLAGGRDRDRPGYLVADHLGNGLAWLDGAGAVAAMYRADAFGNVVAATGSAAWGAAGYAHTRNVLDAGAGGLHDFHNRWYDPATGRFTQRRTPFQPLREHPYALAESNPATWTDRSGLLPDIGEGIYYLLFPEPCAGSRWSQASSAWISNSIGGQLSKVESVYGTDVSGARWIANGSMIVSGAAVSTAAALGAMEVLGTQVVLSGHGALPAGAGSVVVPEGTTVVMYTRVGGALRNVTGNVIELFPRIAQLGGRAVFRAGQQVPNAVLYPPSGLALAGSPVTVAAPTPLGALLGPNMGTVHWAACLVGL